jgi:hypothetical protein
MLDNIDITRLQRGNETHGMQILGMDIAGGRRGTDTPWAPARGKGRRCHL